MRRFILTSVALLLCMAASAQTYFKQKDLRPVEDGSLQTEVFVPQGDRPVVVSFKADEGTVFQLCNGKKKYVLELVVCKGGKFSYSFDPAFHDVYSGTDRFFIRVSRPVRNFKVAAGAGENSVPVMKGQVAGTVDKLPRKLMIFGNSLVFGNKTFGMAASDSKHDYYYLISEYLRQRVTGFVSNKGYLSGFEANEDPSKTDQLIQSMFLDHLDGDEEMIAMNIGDNVNTEAKTAVFRESFSKMLGAIKAKCPRAHIVVMGCWYSRPERYEIILKGCAEHGATFMSLVGMPVPETRSFIGAVQTWDEVGDRSIPGVLNVTDKGQGNIAVSFKVGDKEYATEFNCESYHLEGDVLKYRSIHNVVTSAGVASHPSDAGFKMIADKFIKDILGQK